jgi:hypothetical protein
LEGQSTNLLTYSSELNTGTTGTSSVTANSTISPDGTQNADTIGVGYLAKSVSAAADTYTFSVFAKSETSNNLTIYIYDGSYYSATYDLINGTSTGTGSSIEDFGNGWYRCILTRTIASSISEVGFSDAEVYAYGLQLEQGSYSTSYIPTTSTSTTRLADTSSTTGLSSVIGQTEGTMYVEMASLSNSVTSNYVSISDGSYNNRLSILFSTGTNVIRAFLRLGGSVQCDFNTTAYDITQMNKIAFKYKANDFALWVNGTEVAIDSSGSTFSGSTLTTFAFDEIGTGTGALNGNVQNLMVFPSALTDTELADLTGAVHQSFNS